MILPKSKTYQTLNRIEISTQALTNNYTYFQSLNPQAQIAPVLKSNAYGHGLTLVGKWVDQNVPAPFICVDSLYEAYELHKVKVKTPILIIGYTFPENFKIWKRLSHFTFPVFDEATLASLNKHQPSAKAHIKIDSGMNRLGIQPAQAADFAKLPKKYPRVKITGIYSHLAQVDDPSRISFTQNQLQSFKAAIRQFESRGVEFQWKHLSASAGAATIKDPEFNLIRLGLGFYGYSPLTFSPLQSFQTKDNDNAKNLARRTSHVAHPAPAITLKSHLIQIKGVGKGSQISYGGTFVAKKPMRIGILPIGYYDGLNRKLSNQGKALVRVGETRHPGGMTNSQADRIPIIANQKNNETIQQYSNLIMCDILGRVCMNVTIIDLTNAPQAKVGDEAIIFSPNPNHPNSIEHTAKLCDTIPYEILVKLAESTKRVLVE